MKQADVAERLGISQATVARLMRKYAWQARAEEYYRNGAAGVPVVAGWPERGAELRERAWALHLELVAAGVTTCCRSSKVLPDGRQ
jgi:transcriptional regulator with XRE-family HTH domain